MTHLPGTTSGTASVPVAGPNDNASIQSMLTTLTQDVAALARAVPVVYISDSPPASPSPVATPPAAPVVATAPPVAAGFRTHGPWVAGGLYIVVPAAELLPIAESPVPEGEEPPKWYAITRGKYVGVTLSNQLAQHAILGVSRNGMKGYGTQTLALAAFNEFLRYGLVSVAAAQ
ncbi:hypothetical protein DFH06DRAFT_1342506 [Mycena polygramma]|nr:hypothetical protein DFH06DRAFT_1342506 [Mycena polygramma]